MITLDDMTRAARMFAIDQLRDACEGLDGFPKAEINFMFLRYASGRCDFMHTIQHAISVLKRAEPRSFFNAVQALQYLRGYYSPISKANFQPRYTGDFRFTCIGGAWSTGYFAHVSPNRI